MKRSEALAILSRDHHHALVVAQRLSRADAGTAATARASFLDFWNPDGRRHFQLEEELLLPAYAARGDPYHPLVLRVLGDHIAIRAQIARLATETDPPLDGLHAFGAAFAAHVRLEERELFPMIEEAIPADELLALAHALDRAEHGAAGES